MKARESEATEPPPEQRDNVSFNELFGRRAQGAELVVSFYVPLPRIIVRYQICQMEGISSGLA